MIETLFVLSLSICAANGRCGTLAGYENYPTMEACESHGQSFTEEHLELERLGKTMFQVVGFTCSQSGESPLSK